jgi:quercetin dioxygenase-like cupin family protein
MRITAPTSLAFVGAATLALATATVAAATAPSNETPTPLARGQLVAAPNVNRTLTDGRVGITAQGALDVMLLQVRLAPGGTGGWHMHAGPLINIVKQGTLTIIDANCKRHDIPAGHAVISPGSTPDEDENLGTTPVVFDVTFLLPHSVASPRIDTPAPAGCNA